MKVCRFAVLTVVTTLFALACGSAAEPGVEAETEELGTVSEELTVTRSAEPAAPVETETSVAQAAQRQNGGGEIDGNKDCGGWCHFQCCGDACTTGAAVACVASCIKYMCLPPSKTF